MPVAWPTLQWGVAGLQRLLPRNRLSTAVSYRVARASCRPESDEVRIARLVGGARLWVPFNEWLCMLIYFYGSHETALSRLLLRIAQPGQCWLDIGGHLGVFTMTLARQVGPCGRVIAFEPNPLLADLLGRSIDLNSFSHAELRQCALGAEAGSTKLGVPADPASTPGGTGRASLLAQADLASVEYYEVLVSTLDAEISGSMEVYGVKMDVEGYERAVLDGGGNLFAKRPPRVVVMELNRMPDALASPEELIARMQGYGYDCFALPDLTPLTNPASYEGGWCDNLLAIHPEEVELKARLGIAR